MPPAPPRSPFDDPVPAPAAPVATAGAARAAVTALLSDTGRATVAPLGAVHLVVTELVANAFRHADGMTGFDARVDADGAALVVTVDDGDERTPVETPGVLDDPAALGGRGWPLVRLLAATCRTDPRPEGGKRITVTFPLRPR
ncbi:ATP-binding protein [Kitasatospora sp. NA04385]|uniref:ATP-binding protein n=1 Tax=Kitasatospora sp. NA04385 TaxID=2742135 RepID=UPI00158FC80E|nr:ATP-binding protein [Kitasatospora sp. NA04385]QKW17863.1 ATP-binding protein [Kitasatospora sp. NA04385]